MARRLVVCLDGTGNEIGRTISNVLKLYRAFENNPDQLLYYDPGVGTIGVPGEWARLKQGVAAFAGLAFGVGLDHTVLRAYAFLCRSYRSGDQIYLFGFSRGAHSARVLAGLIQITGLLAPEQLNLCGYALVNYKRTLEDDDHLQRARRFKTYLRGRSVTIRLMGLWDTVSSVIVPRRDRLYLPSLERALPYTRRNPAVRAFRHALAIDERRRMYRPQGWANEQPFRPNPFDVSQSTAQDVRQVWFAGAHADVGGGYAETESQLSKYPLLWMIDQAIEAGLTFGTTAVSRLGRGGRVPGDIAYVGPDATGPLHTSLTRRWWLLEYWPKRDRFREWPGRKQALGLYLPMGEPRPIPEGAHIHQSVLDRIAACDDYRPVNLPASFKVEAHSAAPRTVRRKKP